MTKVLCINTYAGSLLLGATAMGAEVIGKQLLVAHIQRGEPRPPSLTPDRANTDESHFLLHEAPAAKHFRLSTTCLRRRCNVSHFAPLLRFHGASYTPKKTQ